MDAEYNLHLYPHLLKALGRNENTYWLLESLAPKPRRVYGQVLCALVVLLAKKNIHNQCMFLGSKKVFLKVVLTMGSIWPCLGPPTWDRIFDPNSIMNVCLSLSIFSHQIIRAGEMIAKESKMLGILRVYSRCLFNLSNYEKPQQSSKISPFVHVYNKWMKTLLAKYPSN